VERKRAPRVTNCTLSFCETKRMSLCGGLCVRGANATKKTTNRRAKELQSKRCPRLLRPLPRLLRHPLPRLLRLL